MTDDERRILASAITHASEGGYCAPSRVPAAPQPEQARYLLVSLELAARGLRRRLGGSRYARKRADALVESVEALTHKLEGLV